MAGNPFLLEEENATPDDEPNPFLDTEQTPDQIAAQRGLARRTGVDPLDVPGNEDMFERFHQQRLAQEAPERLRAWMAKPGNAAIARDDVEPLAALERYIGTGLRPAADAVGVLTGATALGRFLPGRAGEAARQSQQRGLALSGQIGATWDARSIDEERLRLQARTAYAIATGQGWRVSDAYDRNLQDRATAKRASGVPSGLPEDFVGILHSGVGGLLSGFSGAGDAAVRSARDPLQSPADIPFAAVAGYFGGSFDYTAELEAGSAFDEFRRIRDVNGNPLDEKIAAEAAVAVGIANGTVEFAAGLGFAGMATLSKGLRQRLGAGATSAAVRQIAIAEVAKKYGTQIAATGISEGAEEVTQKVITKLGQEYAEAGTGGEFAPTDWGQFARESAYEGALGALGGVTFGLAGSFVSVQADLEEVRRAEANALTVERLSTAAAASRLRNRDPEAFADAVNNMSGEAVVLVDAEALQSLAQELGLEPAQLVRETGISPKQIADSIEGTGFIPVPLGDYLGKIEKTSLGTSLHDHIVFDGGQMTRAQGRRVQAETEARAAEVMQSLKGDDTQSEALAAIQADVKKQLDAIKNAGGYTPKVNGVMAEFFARAFGNLAGDRAGLDLADAWKRFRPQIIGMAREEAGLAPEIPARVTLYRGVQSGKNPADATDVGRFLTPDRKVAETYAGADGTVSEEEIGFSDLLEAPNWMEAKKALKLDASATMQELVDAARKAGHDGISFTTKNGKEYIQIPENARVSPQDYTDGLTMEHAQSMGFAGTDIGEAAEWVAAVRKYGEAGMVWENPDGTPGPRKLRANKMGFTTPAFRGIRRAHEDRRSDVAWASATAASANGYARGQGGNMMPVLLRLGRTATVNAGGRMWDTLTPEMIGDAKLRKHVDRDFGPVFDTEDVMIKARHIGGLDSVTFENIRDPAIGEAQDTRDRVPADTVYALMDPSGMRSVHAAFDPDRAGEANVLAQATGSTAFFDDRLAETERKAVEMRRNGFSIEQIAEEMDVKPNTVSGYIKRARKKAPDIEIAPKWERVDSGPQIIMDGLRRGLPDERIIQRVNAQRAIERKEPLNPASWPVMKSRAKAAMRAERDTFNQGSAPADRGPLRNIEAEMEVAKAIREAGACAAASGAALPVGAVELMVGNAIGAAVALPATIAAAPVLMNMNPKDPPARLKLKRVAPVETPVWTPEEASTPGPILEPGVRHIGTDMTGEDMGGKSRFEGDKYVPPGGKKE